MLRTMGILIRAIGIFLGLLILMVFVQGLWALLSAAITQDISSVEQLSLEQISPLLVAIILVRWTRKKREKIYKEIERGLEFDWQKIKRVFGITLLSLVIFYGVFGASNIFNVYDFIDFGFDHYASEVIFKKIILVGLFGNLFVAIGEEIIFRGFLLNYLTNLSNSWVFGLLFSSFVFSLHPYPDFLNNVIAFLGGVVLGYSYIKFHSLYISIGIHFAYNFFNFTIASESIRGPQMPYLIKFEYSMIQEGFGAWVDLFIIMAFLFIFLFLVIQKDAYSFHLPKINSNKRFI